MGASGIPPAGADRDLFSMGGGAPFTRRGSWIGIFSDSSSQMIYGGKLYLGSRRGGAADRSDNKVMYLYPAFNGEKIDFGVRTTATELIFRTTEGEIRCCFAEEGLLNIRGCGGLSLRLERDLRPHEMMKKRGEKAWEQITSGMGTVLYLPQKGSIRMKADWDHDSLSTPIVRGEVLPDENGEFLLTIEESLYGAVLRDSYPDYETGLADVTKDWEDFKAAYPALSGELGELREEALFNLWSFLVSPSGRLKYNAIFMTGTAMASSWQMVQNAVALQDNIPVRNGLLMNMLEELGPLGQFPDFVDDFRAQHQGLKPPIQGWGLKWIMKKHDLKAEFAPEDLRKLYEGYARWANWFVTYRDDDHDGIPEYGHGDDTGFDDSTAFVNDAEVEAPDLPAYLGLLYEALGDMAEMLGLPEEAKTWYQRSRDVIDLLVKELWNGEIFICREARTHRPIVSGSLIHYIPFVLGRRLPAEILDRMTADLMKEGEFLTEWGLASEKLTSSQFRTSGMARGFILPPYHILIVTGMYDAGKVAEAKEIARRYCLAQKFGFNMLVHPVKASFGGFGCSWPVCTFLTLGNMLENM